MAKKSMLERERKRAKFVQRDARKRADLKKIISDPSSTEEMRSKAIVKLQKLPRDGSSIRLRNRCAITGRPKGFYRKFGLGRTKLREETMQGNIPGLRKASW